MLRIHSHPGDECDPRRGMAHIFICSDIEQTCIVMRGGWCCSAYFILHPLMGFIWNHLAGLETTCSGGSDEHQSTAMVKQALLM